MKYKKTLLAMSFIAGMYTGQRIVDRNSAENDLYQRVTAVPETNIVSQANSDLLSDESYNTGVQRLDENSSLEELENALYKANEVLDTTLENINNRRQYFSLITPSENNQRTQRPCNKERWEELVRKYSD